jgi:copper chaperone CopZ
MKQVIIIIAFCVLGVSAGAQFTRARLQATGLTCAMCSNAINKALREKSFIESVHSDIRNSAFDIVFRANADVDIDAIRVAVEDAGFAVGNLQLTGNFKQLSIEKDGHARLGSKNFHFVNASGRSLDGERTITVVDKDFLTARQFKKISSAVKVNCIQSGKAGGACCRDIPAGTRVYHVSV